MREMHRTFTACRRGRSFVSDKTPSSSHPMSDKNFTLMCSLKGNFHETLCGQKGHGRLGQREIRNRAIADFFRFSLAN